MPRENNLKHRINHQTQTDLTGEWFSFDKKFKTKRFASFINYKINFARQTSFNWLEFNLKQLQINILQFTEFMTKNILTILATSLLILGVSGATAQAFAPDNLKPTALYQKLFAANKQVERDPYTSLKPDTNNFVSKLDQCDLSLKYPQSLADGSTLAVYRESYGLKEENPLLIESFSLRTEFDPFKKNTSFNFDVECFKPEYQVPSSGLPIKLLTKQELQDKTGWFITQADIKDIRSTENISYGSVVGKGARIEFIFKNKKYLISSVDKTLKALEITSADLKYYSGGKLPNDFTENSNGVFSNQVQIQFDSLIDNQNNKETKVSSTENNKNSSLKIGTQPLDSTLQKTAFRVNENCDGTVLENTNNVPDEPVYAYSTKFNEENPVFDSMTIANTDYSFVKSDQESLKLFNDIILGKEIPKNENNIRNIAILNDGIFRASCAGGFFNYFVRDLKPISYGQKNRIIMTVTGQSEFTYPQVFIFAQNGSDIIMVQGFVLDEESIHLIAKQCGYDMKDVNSNPDNFNKDCYNQKVTSQAVVDKANQLAQKLVEKFKLK